MSEKQSQKALLNRPEVLIKTLDLTDFLIEKDGEKKSHYYSYHVIVLVTEGQGTIAINGNEYHFHRGEIIFIPKNLVHTMPESKGFGASLVIISDEILMQLPQELRQVIDYNLLINKGFRIFDPGERMFKNILNIYDSMKLESKESENARFHNEAVNSLFAAFMATAIRGISRETLVDADEDNLFISLIRLIDQNFRAHLRVTDYASLLGVSSKTLDRHIIKLAGISPQKIIAQKLTSEAKSLLRSSSAPVKEIAFQLGFVDLSQFTNFFKNSTGITPSHFRQAHSTPPVRGLK